MPLSAATDIQLCKSSKYFIKKLLPELMTLSGEPVMLILLVGTGIFLTVRTRFLTWRNLGYALKSTLSKEARHQSRGQGDVSPFSAP